MTSFAFAIGAMLSWGVGDFLIQRTARKIGNIEALGWIGLIGSVGLLPFVYHELPKLQEGSNLVLLVGLGLLVFILALFNFEALKRGKLSVVEVILEIELPITILLGMAFFREYLTGLQWALVGTVFLGILLIAVKPRDLARFTFERGAALALVAAVGMGALNFITALGAREASPLLSIWVPWVVFTLSCLAVLAYRRGIGKFLGHAKGSPGLILGMGLFDTAAWLLFAYAVAGSPLGLTIAITEGYPAVGVMLGILVNKERITWYQMIGAVLAIAGSIAIGAYS